MDNQEEIWELRNKLLLLGQPVILTAREQIRRNADLDSPQDMILSPFFIEDEGREE